MERISLVNQYSLLQSQRRTLTQIQKFSRFPECNGKFNANGMSLMSLDS